jgi:cation transport ATPase
MTLEVYEIAVQGIRCTNCSKRILAAFEGVPEIHAINVSVLAEKVQVSYRECGV